MKKCTKCKETKETTQFSKCSAAKDGLQHNCKSCNSIDNKRFREEINPEHHSEWQRNNQDLVNTIYKKYRKADKTPIIYSIKDPIGEYYIGKSEAYLNVRKLEHRRHFRRAERGKMHPLPLLHDSFRKFGLENHQFEIVVQLEGYDRKQLGFVETEFIKSFQQIGKSLNIRTT